jgi:hypothetical protein
MRPYDLHADQFAEGLEAGIRLCAGISVSILWGRPA